MLEVIQTWAVGVTVIVMMIGLLLALWERFGERVLHMVTYVFEDAIETAGRLLSLLVAVAIAISACMACYSLGRAILRWFDT